MMQNFSIAPLLSRSIVLVLVAGSMILSACDSSTGPDDPIDIEGPVVIEGRVTDDGGYGKRADTIEGASVTAASVRSNGSLQQHDAQVTTGTDGRYSLEIEPSSHVVLLTAAADDFSARALVQIDDRELMRAMPLTNESTVEADVYVDARSSGESHVTAASVAAHVNPAIAARAATGAVSSDDLASAVADIVAAQNEFVVRQSAYGSTEVRAREDAEAEALIVLQEQLDGASSTAVEAAALEAFYESMVDAWTNAEVDLATQAKARAAAVSAATNLAADLESQTRTELRRQTLRLAAIATARAVEAEFEAEGAAGGTLSALADARENFVAGLDAASSNNDMADAADAYQAAVRSALGEELDLTGTAIDAAFSAIGAASNALAAALISASSANAVASAYVTFDAAATSALQTHFADIASADFAAAIILMMSL